MTRNVSDSEHVIRSLDLVIRNPYRILGLPGCASWAEIHDAAAAARRALKLDLRKTTPWDLPFLGAIPRTESAIQDAIGRLATPASRLRERLFWFHDAAEISSVSSPAALDHVAQTLLDNNDALSLHDAALAMLIAAVLCDPLLSQEMRWVEAFQYWHEVVEEDDYWIALLETEIDGDFEPSATGQEIEALRDEAPQLLGSILTGIARRALANERWHVVRQALHIFDEAGFPSRVVSKAQEEILGTIEDSFEALCDEVLRETERNFRDDDASVAQNRIVCQKALRRFDGEIMLEFQKLAELAGPGSDYTRRAKEVAADCLYWLAIAHARVQQFVKAENLFKRARTLAPADSVVLERIEVELIRIAPYAQSELIRESLAQETVSPPPTTSSAVERSEEPKAQSTKQSQLSQPAPQSRAPQQQPPPVANPVTPAQKNAKVSSHHALLIVLGFALLALLSTAPQVLESFIAILLSGFAEPAPTQIVASPAPQPTASPRPTRTPAPTRTPRPSPSPRPMRYIVQPDDTLGILSRRFDVPMAAILGANPEITDPDKLNVGQQLLVPQTQAAIVAAAEEYFVRAAAQLHEKQREVAAAPANQRAAPQAEYERLRRLWNGIVAQYNDYLKRNGG